MSATGFTPIQLYYSTTAAAAPSAGNLAAGELAVNITDGKLFYKDNGGVVRVLATAAGSAGDVVGPGSSTDNALVRFDGTTGKLVQNSVGILSDAGALSGLTSVAATTFTGALTGNASTATTLQTSRTIWGQSFDGSANVTGALTGVTDLTASGSLTLNGGTANGVAYLNGSKVLTTGSALTFDGTNLGVGGTASQRLHVQNAGALIGLLQNTASTADARYRIQNTAGSSDWGVDGTGTYFQDNNSRPFLWFVAGSEGMRLTSTGLGIGTSSPAYKLDVNGQARLGGSTGLVFGVGTAFAGGQAEVYSTSTTPMGLGTTGAAVLRIYTNSTLQATFDSSGNLGLGISSPARRLEVSGAGSGETYQLRLGAGNSNTSFTYDIGRSTVDGLFRFYGNQTGFVGYIFSGVDGERARIDSSGNLLVGTTSNTTGSPRMYVVGARAAIFQSSQANTGGTQTYCTSANNDEPSVLAGNNSSASSGVGTFYSSLGNGNGSQSNTNCYHLKAVTQGVGINYLYGNGTTSFTSDARLKKNITSTRDGYAEDLCKLRVVKYNWNTAPEGEAQELGLIAQEVEQVFPGLVQDADTEIQGFTPKVLKGSVLPFMLLKAIQEQQAIIEQLKARLDAANL